MCLRLYRHYTECGCLLAASGSLRECRHGPTSPLCGPQHTIGIVTREGDECLYHACLTKQQRHAPEQSRQPCFRRPSGPGVTDKEVAEAKVEHLRSLDMRERLDRFKAKGLEGSYRGDREPKPRGGALVFSRQFDGTEYTGHHPYEHTDFEEEDVAQQKTRCHLRNVFLATVQSEGLFDPSDRFLSSAWDDDSDSSACSSEVDPDALDTTSYSEGAKPMAPWEAMNGGSDIVTGEDNAMDVDETGLCRVYREDTYSPAERTLKLKDLTGPRPNRASA
ncbi:uncharacterized protein LY79DRAFT_588447 [Colletotrichum navitas]|uniref:Uncharacterized protein n=1 Tax=Colletotrichum navitas TaxID=681940 RepID=A0AAD8Q4V0_9PEZI|nr:uncharacterized protein LY79DRAFT_588447 [Colletotrichum navitas]KAK1595883.1 hypothetical protein LY79DRAFT_588447 [Colletotrichum navitas]